MKRTTSLRAVLTGSIIALTVVSLVAGVSLVIVTNALNQVSRSLSQSVESVRLTQEAEIGLLVHARLRDPIVRTQSALSVRRNLRGARRFVGTDAESQVLRQSTLAVDEYLAATGERAANPETIAVRLEKAFRSIEQLAKINVRQSQDAREQARRLTRVAEFVSIGVGLVFVVVVSFVLWWLNGKAFRPSFSLAAAMKRFAGGAWDARAPEAGPTELQEMAAHFNQMADKITRQREAQAGFLAGIAHDLRTPLSALKMSAGVVPPDQPLPPEEQIRKTMAIVDRQVDRLERMVNDFLDMARIEAGEFSLSTERHDVRELARSAVTLFEDTSPQHQLELQQPDAPVWVSCDAGRIEQVLNNLMSNAIKYSPEGGKVHVGVEARGDRARISVTDQGVGLTAEDQARVFEPFGRAKLTRQEISGVGLGLFISRRLVEAHGGSIDVASAPGRGSTFTMWLPLASSAA